MTETALRRGFNLLFALLISTSAFGQTGGAARILAQRGVTRTGTPSISSQAMSGLAVERLSIKEQSPSSQRVRIDFFPDVSFTVNFDRVERQGRAVSWSGKVEGLAGSSATFLAAGSVVMASVNPGDGKVYQIRTDESGKQWSVEIDQSLFPNDERDSVPVATPEPTAVADSNTIASDDGSTIDVLVLYTTAARMAAGGTTAIQQLAQLGIAETNTSYSNSAIIQRVRLVAALEVAYSEASAGIATDLSRMRITSDGFLDEASTLRESYGADIVSLWVDTAEATCGVGYVLPNVTSTPTALSTAGFNVVELDCATGNYTFGHEMGHNMGANHAKSDLDTSGDAPVGVFPYSNGYKQTGGTDRFRSVMAYNCTPSCPRIQYFSNPLVNYHLLPTGVEGSSADSADNALTLNTTRTIVSNFRQAVTTGGGGDAIAPLLTITTQSQSVTSNSIAISGTASDAGRGDSGIASVTVNGVRASGDTAAGAGTANWTITVNLSAGPNVISVIAKDNSQVQNPSTSSVTITLSTANGISGTSSTSHVFPQLADGRLGDSIYRTTLMISNPNRQAGTTCTLQIRGATLPGFALNYTLAAGGWVINQTSGAGAFQSGYAGLTCAAAVEAQLLYTLYDLNGGKISEATVFSSPASNKIAIVADEREGAQLGLAIANDSDTQMTYTIAVTNAAQTGTITIPARRNAVGFVGELIPGVPADNLGVVTITANSPTGAASVIGLRFSGPIFTTIPASFSGTIDAAASTYHVFPQFADGSFSDGGYYRTTRIYYNPSSTASAFCATSLRGMTTADRNSFSENLPPGSAIASGTAGTQAFQSGYASMLCTSAVDAAVLYSFYMAGGKKTSEATVFPSRAGTAVQILSDMRGGAATGIAFANDTDQDQTYTVSVYDANNTLIGTAQQALARRSNLAKFVNELVAVPENTYGPVIVSGAAPVSIIGLRFTGSVFTTIPGTLLSAPAGTSPVSVAGAYTAHKSGFETASFTSGQTLRLYTLRTNTQPTALTVSANYKVTGPGTYVLTNSTVASASAPPAGTFLFSIDVPIPANAPAGTYTYDSSVTYNGVTSTKSATFTVASTTVAMVDAYTGAPPSTLTATFRRGQSVLFCGSIANSNGFTVNPLISVKATGPDTSTAELFSLLPSTIPVPAGPFDFCTTSPAPISNTAPTGLYYYEATVSFGANPASRFTTTFTITATDEGRSGDLELSDSSGGEVLHKS